jgi:hypothetical protein
MQNAICMGVWDAVGLGAKSFTSYRSEKMDAPGISANHIADTGRGLLNH